MCLICQNCSHSFRSHLLDCDIGQLKSIFTEYFQNEDHKPCHFFDQLENFIVTDIPFLLNQEDIAISQISVIFKLFLSVYNDNYKWKAINIDRTFGRIKAALKQVSDSEIRKELFQILSQEATKHEIKKTKKRVKKSEKRVKESETWYGPRRNFCLLCRDEKDHTFLKHVWEHSPEKPIGYFAKRYFEIHKNKRNHIAFYMERVSTFVSIEIDGLLKDSKFHPDGDKKSVLVEVFDELMLVYRNFHHPNNNSISRFYSKFKKALSLVENVPIKKDLENVLLARLSISSTPQFKSPSLKNVGESSPIPDQSIDADPQTEHTLDRVLPSIDDICKWPPSIKDSNSSKYASDLDFYRKNPTIHCSQNYKSSKGDLSKKPFLPYYGTKDK